MLHQVIISLASNYEQEANMAEARRRLNVLLHVFRFTIEIWTEPYGTPKRPDPYMNQLLYGTTSLSVDDLQQALKEMELQMGRTKGDREAGIVRIDLDLMKYDDQGYHLRDWERPYIGRLLLS